MYKMTGFTLIEIMIVVIIIGLLAAIAIPNYTDMVTKSRIPAATSELSARRTQMEMFFQDNRSYENAPACPTVAVAINNSFTVSCVAAPTSSAYTLQAVGRNAMAGFSYQINEAGQRSTLLNAARTGQGWAPSGVTAGTAIGCWVTSKGGQC